MNDRLKDAFDKIQAEEELKSSTKDFLLKKTKGYKVRRRTAHKYLVPALASVLILLFCGGGYLTYFTATSSISVDVNPSIELGINRFDKVVSVTGYNDDGNALAQSLNIRFLNYEEAIDQILSNEDMEKYMSENQFVSITVIGKSEEKKEEILDSVSSCTSSYENVHCSSGNSHKTHEAHEAGMSFGKYEAYLELKELDPDITLEEVKGLSMCQIRDRIDSLLSGGTQDYSQDKEKNGIGEDENTGHGSEHSHNTGSHE